jgi:hypothetical protein
MEVAAELQDSVVEEEEGQKIVEVADLMGVAVVVEVVGADLTEVEEEEGPTVEEVVVVEDHLMEVVVVEDHMEATEEVVSEETGVESTETQETSSGVLTGLIMISNLSRRTSTHPALR